MNGVISVALRVFVLLGRAVIRARGLERRYGAKRVLRGLDLDVARGDFTVVTGPNGSGKTTLLRLVAGLAAPTGGELAVDVERAQLGYLAHEPLVYRELTALENLDLYARLYRVPERASASGMLLERFGLWDARNERASHLLARDAAAARALPRAAARARRCCSWTSRSTGSTPRAPTLLDRELAERRGRATFLVATHDPDRLAQLATGALALA